MQKVLYLLVVCLVFTMCKDSATSKYPALDLLEYGFPIEIKAPEGAEVKKSDLGVMADVTVKSGDDFYVQIFGSDATTVDAKAIKADLLQEVKGSAFFSKVLEEYDNGFIFEKKIDDRVNYDFRYVKVQGDREYLFQTGLVGTYTEAQVKEMYNAVQ